MQVLNKKQSQAELVKSIVRRHKYDDIDAIYHECVQSNLPVERGNLPRFCDKLKKLDKQQPSSLAPQKTEHQASGQLHPETFQDMASKALSSAEIDAKTKHIAHRIIKLSDMLGRMQVLQNKVIDRIADLSKTMGAFEPVDVSKKK